MSETPLKQGLREAETPQNGGFPRGPSRKLAEAKARPPYSSDTVGGYLSELKPSWRKRVREQFKSRGGKDGKLNKSGRELLADCVWEIACEAEESQTRQKVVDQLFDLMNRLYDETGLNEIPKWARGEA